MAAALARNTSNKVIAGVCSGIARRLGVSPTLVRVAFLVSIVLPGPQVFLYLVLWVLLPPDPYPPRP